MYLAHIPFCSTLTNQINLTYTSVSQVSRFHLFAFKHSSEGIAEREEREHQRIEFEAERAQTLLHETQVVIAKNADLLFSGGDNPYLVHTTDMLKNAFRIEWNMMNLDQFIESEDEIGSMRGCMERSVCLFWFMRDCMADRSRC